MNGAATSPLSLLYSSPVYARVPDNPVIKRREIPLLLQQCNSFSFCDRIGVRSARIVRIRGLSVTSAAGVIRVEDDGV